MSDAEFSTGWAAGHGSSRPLIGEMYAIAGVSVPELVDPDDELSWSEIGSVAARRDGLLLAWATVYGNTESPDVAMVQHLYIPREVDRLRTGFYAGEPAVDEEREVAVLLYQAAADQARTAGYRVLVWHDIDNGPSGDAARALNAQPVHSERTTHPDASWRESTQYELQL
ncbi:hypothetical protein [Nocardia sp. NPDC051570]|uniref:hypothetical protein n=1 Tax=Nocardia sp. NPDC051570 TaxID=3364324 RepID=UPI00378FE1E0